jgi:2-dehydro-3-deoxyglucarate aldolase/4-hydroxy-2-oxoheptanedioate aldolase
MNMNAHAKLREQKTHFGTWLSIGSPVIAELAADSGFDWLLFDLEHGCGSEAALFPQLQAIRGSATAAIVRVGAPHPDLVLRALDWGADGLMVPHISSGAEAEACVQAAHYPPRGRRGLSRSARAYGYGLRWPADPKTIQPPLLMAQIETIEGVEHAPDIARVEGIDVLFVGPADLNFDLQARPAVAVRNYEDCLKRVAAAAASAGKACGILARTAADLHSAQGLGFSWLALNSDLSILREGFRQVLGQTKP